MGRIVVFVSALILATLVITQALKYTGEVSRELRQPRQDDVIILRQDHEFPILGANRTGQTCTMQEDQMLTIESFVRPPGVPVVLLRPLLVSPSAASPGECSNDMLVGLFPRELTAHRNRTADERVHWAFRWW